MLNVIQERVIENVIEDINAADNRDTINKLYRQARAWSRFMVCYAEAMTNSEKLYFNNVIKEARVKRLRELGYRAGKYAKGGAEL